ncbi:MAG: glycosyl hydrolase [Chthonomonadales bacterium]
MAPETLLLGTRKGLFIYQKTGEGWVKHSQHFLGIPVSVATRDPKTGLLWASLDHGHWGHHLHVSPDLGATWREIPVPTYPEDAEYKPGKPATLEKIWSLLPSAHHSGRMYIGTAPGGLFYTDDEGASYHLFQALWDQPSRQTEWFAGGEDSVGPVIHSVIEHPNNRDHLYVGISCAGVFETQDGGATWLPKNKGLIANFMPDPHCEIGHDPHCLVMCQSSPNVLWQQNHCGIFHSNDGGANWIHIVPTNSVAGFGFPICVDPNDPDTAWVVPAISDECRIAVDGALCASRTTDGGKTWVDYRNGLPQSDCFDIVFRQCLAQSGNDLAFGSTTGNVFVSDDRGENWSCLTNCLPPVYSIQFA